MQCWLCSPKKFEILYFYVVIFKSIYCAPFLGMSLTFDFLVFLKGSHWGFDVAWCNESILSSTFLFLNINTHLANFYYYSFWQDEDNILLTDSRGD